MRSSALLLAVPLLAAAGWCADASDACRVTPRAPPGAASLLGGFTALAVQVLWMRADVAMTELREDDAQLAFAAIGELEPQLVSASDYIARALGFTMARGHKEPAVRWALAREGWRVLCRTVERNPGESRAFAARGRYALLRLNGDAAMRDGFLRDVDRAGPLEAARRDYEEALRLRPQWREPWDGVALASLGRGVEELAERGAFDAAGPMFRRAAEAFDHVVALLREDGDPLLAGNLAACEDQSRLASALAQACAAPATERAARYEDVRRRFAEAELPPLAPR